MNAVAMGSLSLLLGSTGAVCAGDAATNWMANCVPCHGKSGAADTVMGKKLKAKNLTDPAVQAGFSDTEAAEAIKHGVNRDGHVRMIAFGDKLSDNEIKALVAYVRTLKK